MGHTRLGPIPKTRKWEAVVRLLESEDLDIGRASAHITDIASFALGAAEGAIKQAKNDVGLTQSLYLLIRILQATREPNPVAALDNMGIRLSDNATAFQMISQFQDLLDKTIIKRGPRTGVTEIAQQAAGETLSSMLGSLEQSLFKTSRNEILQTLRSTSTKAGFSKLGRTFFAQFLKRFLNFYLSRASASLVSSPSFAHVGGISDFDQALELHCYQSAHIVEAFAGSWYSKASFKSTIDIDHTKRFIAVSLQKIADELNIQGGRP